MAITARLPAKWLALIMLIQIPNLLGFVFIPLAVAWIHGEVSFSEDIRTGIRLAFAWLGAAAVFTSIFATMRVDELTDGIRGVGLPKAVANGVSYAFRLLYSSLDDLFSIVDYLKHKGVDLQNPQPVPAAQAAAQGARAGSDHRRAASQLNDGGPAHARL